MPSPSRIIKHAPRNRYKIGFPDATISSARFGPVRMQESLSHQSFASLFPGRHHASIGQTFSAFGLQALIGPRPRRAPITVYSGHWQPIVANDRPRCRCKALCVSKNVEMDDLSVVSRERLICEN
jgi:hypothetical protein